VFINSSKSHERIENVLKDSSHRWPRICSVFRSQNNVLHFANIRNTTSTCTTNEAGTSTLSEYLSSSLVFLGVHVVQSVCFSVLFRGQSFVFSYLFLLAIVLAILLRSESSNYPFGIFKLLNNYIIVISYLLVQKTMEDEDHKSL